MMYDIGDTVRMFFAFTTSAGALASPTTTTLKYKPPSSAIVSKLYGTDAEAKLAATTLAAAIADAVVTSIQVAANTGFPAGDGEFPITDATAKLRLIRIGTETMRVTGGFGTLVWTVERGVGGTTAAAHSNGDAVTGPFYIDVAVTEAGDWEGRGIGTGAVAQAAPVNFGARASALA